MVPHPDQKSLLLSHRFLPLVYNRHLSPGLIDWSMCDLPPYRLVAEAMDRIADRPHFDALVGHNRLGLLPVFFHEGYHLGTGLDAIEMWAVDREEVFELVQSPELVEYLCVHFDC